MRFRPLPMAMIGLAMQALPVIPSEAAAPISPRHQQTLNFHCTAAANTRLTNCRPTSPTDLDTSKIAVLEQRLQDMCDLPGVKAGQEIDKPVTYVDTAQFWSPMHPDLLEKVSPRLVGDVFPETAQRAGVSGRAAVHCDVSIDSKAENCTLVFEDPPGWGFGAATLRLVSLLRFRPKMDDCKPVPGGEIVYPMIFLNRGS